MVRWIMWESGDINSNQATNNQRQSSGSNAKGIYRLLAFISFCLLIYKAWGPLLLVTCSLAVILHLCYSLHVNDSVFTPYSLVLLGHAKSLALELSQTLQALLQDGLHKSRVLLGYLRKQYEEKFKSQIDPAENNIMSDAKRNLYRPSVLVNPNSTDNLNPRNSELYHSFALNGIANIGKTSTPIPRGSNFKKNEMQNGGVNVFTPTNNTLIKNVSSSKTENKPTLDLSQTEDILYSSKNSSWNYSMSPKSKDMSESIRTVQSVAGPLLNSSRYNIDPKLYTDINSPGLSSRLTRYAAQANSSLIHQSQYGAGQFPKVILNASPIPVLSPTAVKSRMPVTVRVAPPEISNYVSSDNSSQQEKSKTYESMDVRESRSCPNVVQVLKKMAVKRQASRDDIMLDLAKKQKSDQEYEDQLENLEEIMQKRARDESTSDGEPSPQSNNQRPSKKQKSLSCHDVLHSLSSSNNVFAGTKRKAMDSSRCSSPVNEKHFKPSNTSTSPTRSSSLTLLTAKELARSREQLNVRVSIENASGEPHQNRIHQNLSETSQPDNDVPQRQQPSPATTLNVSSPKIVKETVLPKDETFADKLFMKPEPTADEKLKSLIKEQGKVEAQFKTNNKNEIKKQDIDNMKQNSMRQRLKSMFDAISGNYASKIDPDVVIQAEEVNTKPTITASFATLNSLTTTTTVNTSPITTTIVPILKIDATSKSGPASKHVTFNIPASLSSLSSSSSSLLAVSTPEAPKSTELKTVVSSSSTESIATSTSGASFNFGNKPVTSSTATSSSLNPASTGGFSFSANSSVSTTAPSTSATETKSPASNSTSTLFSTTSTVKTAPSASSSAVTSGFSFGTTTVAKTTSPTSSDSFTPSPSMPSFSFTSHTTSVPSFSFSSSTTSLTASTFSINSNASLTSAKSTNLTSSTSTPVLGFGNTLSKSPSSTSITPTTTSSSTNLISTPSSIFTASSTNSPFSMNNASNSNTIPVSTSATATTTAASTFSFNTNNKPATGGFSFNTTTTSTSTPIVSSSTFNFATGLQNNATSASSASTFALPSAPSSTSTAPAPAFNSAPSPFNTSTNSPSIFSGASAMGSSPMFKSPANTVAPTTSAPSIFSNSPSVFGTTQTSIAPTTTTPSLFGNNAPVNTIPSLFGNTASTTISTAPTNSPFGVPATQSSQQSSIFSGIKPTTTMSSSIFGTSTPSASLFSGTNSAAKNPGSSTGLAENTNIFGQSKPFSGATSTFGTNNQSSGFSSPSLNNPSSASSPTSAFQTSNNLSTFGKPMTTFGVPSTTSGGSIFGSTSTNTGTFGPTASSSTFGSGASAPANIFGSSATTQTSTFGSSTSTFGSGSSAFGTPNATTSPFGGASTSTQAPSLFGNTQTTSPANSATFSFGGAQATQQQQQQQQPGTAFTFGSTSNASTAGNGGMFQFGGANEVKPAGFSFNAPTGAPSINFSGSTAPPAFNAPAPNMFSIGAGSSTPRRSSRSRRQR
ncbi:nuclear pore complex protein DDB_G0274915 isoform X2 [Copidosoma floridanum]|uniref:nuclear pore complex protein DDB_G0274915 isoform X2 n=1 Tax=Copidosoma floridanum TaxID=29053 RepID=UPI0006C9B414|nr:nuclear pore complex protein DDB_G0274915 isoform X2 [Copidosoma floridanum]